MRIAIVHYHQRPGGVTRVIGQSSAALTDQGVPNVVLTGESVHGLGYGGHGDPGALAARLRESAGIALGHAPDAWIFHNPTLGKNCDIPEVIARFAREGEAVLQHIHDLAEDGRPENFANIPNPARLHLTAPRVHHAFINSRDRKRFIKAGLPPERAHLLPNPVPPAGASATHHPPVAIENPAAHDDCFGPLIFFPVRGIRRKNLGELCLLTALAPNGTRFVISRAPENPDELATHDFWRNFATAHDLPVWFDATDRLAPHPGHHSDFNSWVDASTHWISTSVAEGFGHTLADAAACGKPLIARALDTGFTPGDTRGIYRRIGVHGEISDFATLGEADQAEVIRRVIASPAAAALIEIDHHPAIEWLRARIADRRPPQRDPRLALHTPEYVASVLLGIIEALVSRPPASLETRILAATFLDQPKLAALYRDSPALLAHLRPQARHEFPRAVIFDVYGTLLDAPPGGVRPDPSIDPVIIDCLERRGIKSPAQPTSALAELVRREHAASERTFPEIDLAALWAELLGLPADARTASLVADLEDLWHPARPMPGAREMLRRLAAADIPCGLLSNAQANVWRQLGRLAPGFASDLCVLSYQHRCAKPSPKLFEELKSRLARRGIAPHEIWFIGNDPRHDTAPGKEAGFRTALYGNATCHVADLRVARWDEFFPAGPAS